MVFQNLDLWIDPMARSGPAAMAVDEWLLETSTQPVLRVYRWSGEWGSIGYFGKLGEAEASFPAVRWVRRWTGGGTVDHRADWTYTVVAPIGENLARLRGAESYRAVHAALAEALADEGIRACLSTGSAETGNAACFENPVGHDLVNAAGRKIAGAGQRRGLRGLLHQGSLALPCATEASERRAVALASKLANAWRCRTLEPPEEIIARKVRERYGRESWTGRR